MDTLNTKIRSSRDDNYTEAQVVGITGYNAAQDRMKVAHVTDNNELKVAVTTGGGGGTQYAEGAAIPAGSTGTIALASDNAGNAAYLNVTAGGALRVDEAGITVGSDDTLSQAQQVLVYGRKDASPSGLRAIEVDNEGQVFTTNQNITSGSDAILSSAQQVLCYGRDAGGNLDALKTDNTGKLEVVQDPEMQVAVVSSTTQTINNGTALTFATAVDKNGAENINCLISASSSLISCSAYFLLSDDNVTFYETPMPQFFGDTNNGYVTEIGNPSRYVKIKIENNGGSNIDITSVKVTWVKGI